MNREILFRGKHVDNGEWVYGLPSYDTDGYVTEISAYKGLGCSRAYMVIPETVGQYTGKDDKNGRKIFEGDMVKTKKYGKVIGHTNVNDYDVFKVTYEPAVFRLTNNNRGFELVGIGTDYEVIGNIHDNPELLEASE